MEITGGTYTMEENSGWTSKTTNGMHLDQGQNKDIRRAFTGKAVWNKVVKRFKTISLTSASLSKPSVGYIGKSLEIPGKTGGKQVGWVRSISNAFQHHGKKQRHHSRGFEMSSFTLNDPLLQDGTHPTPSTIPPPESGKGIWKAKSIGEHYHHSSEARNSRKSVIGVLRKFSDSDPKHLPPSEKTFTKVGFGYGSEESIPLLEYNIAGCHSANASSSVSTYDPVTSHNLPPPWMLRKWRLRDSRKLLKIDLEKELLFHRTDDVGKQYKCTIKMENRSRIYVAFKFMSTCPQGYLMRPKHGVLAPNATIEVNGLKIEDPLFPSTSKKDRFIIVTLAIPAAVMENRTEPISSSIFDRFHAQCCCEGVFNAAIVSEDSNITESNVEGQAKDDAFLGSLKDSLPSIPEEYGFEYS